MIVVGGGGGGGGGGGDGGGGGGGGSVVVVVWCSVGIKSHEIFRLVLQGINIHISTSHS